MSRYRKRPVEIDAFQWTGGPDQTEDPLWIVDAIAQGKVRFNDICSDKVSMTIRTLEGDMTAHPGDWVIRGIKGELYPCRDDIFQATYEAVED